MNTPQSSSQNTKIIIVGSSSIGKSTFIQQYVNGKYLINPNSTVLCDFFVKTVKYKEEKIRLEIWDTAGQQQYQNLINQFYRNTKAVILAFDINSLESLSNLDFWYNDINNQLGSDVIKVLIATRCDLKGKEYDDRGKAIKTIDPNIIKKYKDEKGLQYFETSSKLNTNVNETFLYIIEQVVNNSSFIQSYDNSNQNNQQNNNNISLINTQPQDNRNNEKNTCCS